MAHPAPEALVGLYELALDLGRQQLQRVVGNGNGDVHERMAATALLLSLNESQAVTADVAALAKYVAATEPHQGEDFNDEFPNTLLAQRAAAFTELTDYFVRAGRRPPWIGLR